MGEGGAPWCGAQHGTQIASHKGCYTLKPFLSQPLLSCIGLPLAQFAGTNLPMFVPCLLGGICIYETNKRSKALIEHPSGEPLWCRFSITSASYNCI